MLEGADVSIQLLIGAAMVAGAAPVGILAGARRPNPAGTALRRGMTPHDDRGLALHKSRSSRLLTPVAARLARGVHRLTPTGVADRLEAKVVAAGLQGSWSIDSLLGFKLALGIAGAMLGVLRVAGSPGPLSVGMAAVLTIGAWTLPDFLASQRADARRRRIQQELPDTMDQLTIAVEAGLGFEAALLRVAHQGTGPLAEELRRTMQDIQLGMARSEALGALGSRTSVTDLQRFVAAIRQAERYGLPVANVLRIQAGELRDKRRQRAEEHAMKIPVKVLFPLIFCILPTLFVVILGPGAIRFMQTGGLGG
jgi:tight adherence protein C